MSANKRNGNALKQGKTSISKKNIN
ncbi:hypothetical protein RO1_07890 [Roseburia intestinalis XB6B4]|uniref:Uncharacterized protein n=1 Tax=Roseburia intestinalis XB6B4 TaxID=718255 RepID=D4KVV1_9FIRM|nr:hypothetical protein RO1_07890 [Roseburia intestinalis XB6B4]